MQPKTELSADIYTDTLTITGDNGITLSGGLSFTVTRAGAPIPVPDDDPPTVITNTVTGITASGAALGGNVASDGGAAVTERGFVYGTTANPAIGGAGVTKAVSGNGTGTFSSTLSGLAANTAYHVRAYATNSEGTSYGADVTFTTLTAVTPPDDDDEPGYISRTLADSATGITVSGNIHRDAVLTIGNIDFGNNAACNAIRQRMSDNNYITLLSRDISLSHGFTGTLTITIPVGNAYNGETATILHCAGGTLKTYTATVTGGKATFTVTSLSPFAVFADADDALDNIPKTGDSGGFTLWLGLLAAAALGGSLLLLLSCGRRRQKRI